MDDDYFWEKVKNYAYTSGLSKKMTLTEIQSDIKKNKEKQTQPH